MTAITQYMQLISINFISLFVYCMPIVNRFIVSIVGEKCFRDSSEISLTFIQNYTIRLHNMRQTACIVPWFSIVMAQRFGPQTQWRPQHKAFIMLPGGLMLCGFLSLRLAVCVWLAKGALLCFIVVINLIFEFSLWCIDRVREPLCEPDILFLHKELHREPLWKSVDS